MGSACPPRSAARQQQWPKGKKAAYHFRLHSKYGFMIEIVMHAQNLKLERGGRKILSSHATWATQQNHVFLKKKNKQNKAFCMWVDQCWNLQALTLQWQWWENPNYFSIFPHTKTYSHHPSSRLWSRPPIWKNEASYLGDVDLGPFSSRHHHRLEVVIFREGFLCRGASFVSSIIENAIHLILKCLAQCVSWGGF